MGGNIGKVLFWIAGAVVLLAFLWFVPQLQGQHFSQGVPKKEVPALVNEYRRTWAQILGGAALLLGLYFTWRGQRITQLAQEENQRSTQEQLSLAQRSQEENQRNTLVQLENAKNTLDLARQGQITDRFTQAIELLGKIDEGGSKNLEMRLGGIYALERIAKESEADRWPIIGILATYVRQHAPRKTARESLAKNSTYRGSLPDPDVQTIMTTITHINLPFEESTLRTIGDSAPDPLINLNNTELPRMSFDSVFHGS